MKTDFIGRRIDVGCYLAKAGGGNRTAEYGMLLLRVDKITDKAVHCTRLAPRYKATGPEVFCKKTIVRDTNKVVRVSPRAAVCRLFAKVENGILTQQETKTIAAWIHGSATV